MSRREWCAWLAKLVSPAFPADAARALIDMLPALSRVPDTLFTPETAAAVARWKRRQSVPALDEVEAALRDYRKLFVHEPRRALPPPDETVRSGPSEDEKAAVHALVQQAIAEMRAMALARDAAQREGRPEPRPLPDVTAKGEHLRQIRERCGLNVPVHSP